MAVPAEQQQPSSASSRGQLWDSVLQLTKSAQERNVEPLVWAVQLSSRLKSAAVSLPSVELAHLLVSHICWENHVPITWKFLERAMTVNIVPPMLALALLSTKVVPCRHLHPSAYRLYLELIKRHTFLFASQLNGPNCQKIIKSVDDVLQLSQLYGLPVREPGVILVEFVFTVICHLLDATLDDEHLLELTPEKSSKWPTRPQGMEIDGHDSFSGKRNEHNEGLQKSYTAMAIEIIVEFLQNKVSSRILCLARRNMPSHWGGFIQHMQVLGAHSSILRTLKHITPEALLQLTSDSRRLLTRECKTISQQEFHAVLSSGSLMSSACQSHGASSSAFWLPIDLFLEDAMDGTEVAAASAIDTLTGLVKALQAVNGTTWHNAFLGLWVAALRLIQRERDSREGPVPRLDTGLCMLLSITTLAVTNIVEEEEVELMKGTQWDPTNQGKEKQVIGKCRRDVISCLQRLGDYETLLTAPKSLSSVANQAAAKAMMFKSGLTVSNGYYDPISVNDMPINCTGNLRHLIVEACIARNLLDTSAYFWPGYVVARSNQVPRNMSGQVLGWSSIVKGISLTPSIVNTLVTTPASSLAELETIYEVAVTGSDEEKISAATILCGASLVRGWNIQEHTCLFVIRLLSPPVPADASGNSHLMSYASFFNVLLVGVSSIDSVQIFSLLGLVPLLAAALMPICEVFGSSAPAPSPSWTPSTGEELSCHAVFSNAFTLLLRLWRFDHPPLEHMMGDLPTVGSQVGPEYLLLLRNARLATYGNSPIDRMKSRRVSKFVTFSAEPITMDSFPKLKLWYQQHQKCISSTLSGLEPGTPVHQIVDALLTTMFRKMNRSSQPTPATSGSSNSSASATDESSIRLKVPAWDILEATPFVLDAALTACAYGRLSPRELATGLKELADYLPATLATIVSFFSAEVTRGIWKPAFMNGTDWPSPAANLSMVEQQIKKILAATGVDVPSLAVGGNAPATLPLPFAALVSLTITYKLDRPSERALTLIGPALKSLAAGCPWPCMPILASLWAQKVKRWSDYLVFSASQTVFHHNGDAVVQLLKSCFTATLGLSSSHVYSNGGVGALLGHGFGSHFIGGIAPVAPGIMYLRVHRSVRDVMFMTEEILSILMLSVRDISSCGLPRERVDKLKKTKHAMRYGQVSLTAAMARVRLAASLGASLVWISGGSSLVQSLIKETLPSWFISGHGLNQEGKESGGMVAMLGGYAVAYFAVLCGTFAWGVDSAKPASKRRPKVLGAHLEFVASALDGKFSLGCDWPMWRAYVSGFVSLMVACTQKWVLEVDVEVLKRVSKGLRLWNEEELAMALLGLGGVGAMGAAAELVIDCDI